MTQHDGGQAYDPNQGQYPGPYPGPQPGSYPTDRYPAPYPPPQPGAYPPPAGYPAGPYGAQPPPPPTPARRRRVHPAVLVVGIVVVVAALVGTLVAVLTGGDVNDAPGTGGRRLAVPASIEGYRDVPGVNTDDLKANLGEGLARGGDKPADVVRHAAVAALEQVSTGNRVVFVGIALRDIPSLRGQVRSDGVESSLKFFLGAAARSFGAGGRTTAYSPGPLKGFLRCTSGTSAGEALTACAWGDQSNFALTVVGGVSEARGAAITRELRAKIESR